MAESDVGKFGTVDYVVFSCMLAISVSIGIFHAFAGGKQKTTKEFLLANRNMHPLPVAMSLVASFISAITVLGTPAENYIYGSMFWLYGFAYILAGLAVWRFFLPVFYRLNITSANEYLERRFNKIVRLLGMLTFQGMMIFYMGIVIYAPALALNQVTEINLWGAVVAIGLVCTFYTTIGGMKAVLWTDVFQVCVMLAGFLAVIIEGCRRVGGIKAMWAICEEGGRIDFWDFSVDPTVRHTFWSIVIGGGFNWTATYGVNQSQVQRYLTCKSEKSAKLALFMAIIGMVIVVSLACLAGLTMYAFYADCDPYTLGYVSQTDQLMPYFVLDLFGHIPGLPGLFVSSVFSAALSTVSSGLNALSAVFVEDFVKAFWKDLGDTKYTVITKIVACCYGLFVIFIAYIASILSAGVLQIALSMFGMIGGPLLGLFCLGMCCPWTNSKGAATGLIVGLAFIFWIGVGAIMWPPYVDKPPLSIEGCLFNSSFTTPITTTPALATSPPITKLYSISYAWYTCISWSTTVSVGLLVSFLTGATKPRNVDRNLLQPVVDAMYCCLPESWKRTLRCGVAKYYEYDMDEGNSFGMDQDVQIIKIGFTSDGNEDEEQDCNGQLGVTTSTFSNDAMDTLEYDNFVNHHKQ